MRFHNHATREWTTLPLKVADQLITQQLTWTGTTMNAIANQLREEEPERLTTNSTVKKTVEKMPTNKALLAQMRILTEELMPKLKKLSVIFSQKPSTDASPPVLKAASILRTDL
jgi:heterodisulfide reductase subunit C